MTLQQYRASDGQQRRARGRTDRCVAGEMNGTERSYAALLESRRLAGEIVDYWFERLTFKLADDCRYTPDFIVMMPDGELQAHEVKGFFREDALIKIKVAAQQFPFTFIAVFKLSKRDGGGWKERVF